MSQKVTDSEGNEIELFTQAELDQKAEEAKKAVEEAKKKEIELLQEDHKKKMAEKTDQIVRLRDMTDVQKAALSAKDLEDLKAREAILADNESTKAQLADLQKREIENQKSAALDALGIFGEEDRKKAMLGYDRIMGDMKTPEEIRSKMGEAVNMQGLGTRVGSGFRAPGSTGAAPRSNGGAARDFADTDAGKDLAGKLNLGFIKEKK